MRRVSQINKEIDALTAKVAALRAERKRIRRRAEARAKRRGADTAN